MAETMLLLSKEWVIGSSVCIGVVLVGYLLFSVLLVRRCRKRNYDVGASAFVPVVSLFIWVKSFKYKNALVVAEDDYISDEAEFEL